MEKKILKQGLLGVVFFATLALLVRDVDSKVMFVIWSIVIPTGWILFSAEKRFLCELCMKIFFISLIPWALSLIGIRFEILNWIYKWQSIVTLIIFFDLAFFGEEMLDATLLD